MLKKRREPLIMLTAAVLLLLFCWQASRLFMPERNGYGGMWKSFLKEEKNSFDVMFFGSSLAYCDVIPAVVWQESGASPYVLAGPSQTVPILYYYLKEAYRTQNPKYVFIEASNTFYRDYEDFTKANVDYMPWSINRIGATLFAAEKEERFGLFFPLYNYHGRWNELSRRDVTRYLYGYEPDPLAGYTFLNRTNPQDSFSERNSMPESYERNLSFQQKIVDLAAENGSQVVYYITPCVLRPAQSLSERLEKDLLALGDVLFIDFNRNFEDIGFDMASDFFDALHLNYRGAQKFSSYLGSYLLHELNYQPDIPIDDEAWQQRLYVYEAKAASASADDGL